MLQIPVDVDRTVKAFYKFLRKHASIPFQLQKPASTTKPGSETYDVKESQSSSTDVKDELWELNYISIYKEIWFRVFTDDIGVKSCLAEKHIDWVRKNVYFSLALVRRQIAKKRVVKKWGNVCIIFNFLHVLVLEFWARL